MPFRSDFATVFGVDIRIAAVVFGAVSVTMVTAFAISLLRKRRGRPSSQRSTADRLELTYLGGLAVIAAGLIAFSLHMNNLEVGDPARPAMQVNVTAFQWCWKFRYVGQPVTVVGRCKGGRLPVLVLPSDEPIRVNVTSADVIHGFWITHLRWKIYAYPGHVNSFTVTLRRNGTWVGRCSELCGLFHYQMDFYLRVVPPARFRAWLHAHRSVPGSVRFP
ncbi:MAG: cytochrome c oxidase subunit II [Streptosporangiaceae bacterium]